MPSYERVTRYIPLLEKYPAEDPEELGGLVWDCYEPDLTDHDYFATLEGRGIASGGTRAANVEALDLRGAVALLTFVLRADHFCEGALRGAMADGYLLRILRRIAELDGTWARPNVVTFYHEYEKDGYLSNWFEAPFDYLGTTFPTAEHWMMWQKARVFRDPDTAVKILAASDQGTVKQLGRRVPGYSDGVWDAVNQQLMRVGLRQKFAQNPRLLNDLLSTGSAALGEAAGDKDPKWGVGLSKGDPQLDDPASWYGQNLLGRTLADVRSDLRQLSAKDGAPDWPTEALEASHVWNMSLLELARVPSTRPFALMYATIVARHVPHYHDAREVLRQVRASIGGIDESMRLNMGGGLPAAAGASFWTSSLCRSVWDACRRASRVSGEGQVVPRQPLP